jgi:arsenical pump membrane protein
MDRASPRPTGHPCFSFSVPFQFFSAIIAAVLNNDAAILLLTPLIVGVIRRCYPRQPELVVPFAFAVLSAAGVAPLVISNPINLIVSEYAGIGFNEYAARLSPIAVAGSVTSYLILRTVFRRQLHAVPGWETRSLLRRYCRNLAKYISQPW